MFKSLAGALMLMMGTAAGIAQAEELFFDHDINEPMRFVSVYMGNAYEGIAAEGQIMAETPDAFREFLARERPARGMTIDFNSNGGSLIAGLRLGELIRAYGLNTSIGKTTGTYRVDRQTGYVGSVAIEGGSPGICLSACAYAFIGGVTRFVREGSTLGVHQHADSRSLNDPLVQSASALDRSIDQMATAVVLEYVTRMGVPPDIVTLAQATPPWEIYEIGTTEARRIGVDNSEISFSALTVRAMNDGAVAEVESSDGAVIARLYCISGSHEPHLAFIFRHEEADADIINGYQSFTQKLSFQVSAGGDKKVFRTRRVAFGSSRPNSGGMVVAMSYAFPEEAAPHLRSVDTVEVEFDWEASRVELSYHAALSAAFDGDRRLIDLVMHNCIRGS